MNPRPYKPGTRKSRASHWLESLATAPCQTFDIQHKQVAAEQRAEDKQVMPDDPPFEQQLQASSTALPRVEVLLT